VNVYAYAVAALLAAELAASAVMTVWLLNDYINDKENR
jgi:hypothetical protein